MRTSTGYKLTRAIPAIIAILYCFESISGQTVEKRPQIDVQKYTVEAELIPASHELKGKASLQLVVQEKAINQVILEFNGALKPAQVYFADKPPFSSPPAASAPEAKPVGDVPYLTRAPKKKPAPAKPEPPSPAIPVEVSPVLKFHQYLEDSTLEVDLGASFRQGETLNLTVEYSGVLESADQSPVEGVQTAYVGEDISYLLDISRWFPLNALREDRAKGEFRITVPIGYQAIMDGSLKGTQPLSNKTVFTYAVERDSFPGSLAVGRFNLLPVSAGPVEMLFCVRDAKRDFVNGQAEVIGKITELYAEKFGFFPVSKLKVVVIDNKSLLGYSAPGIQFLADRAFEAAPNGDLLARELAYQYWRNLIVPKSPEDLWLTEGFAAYGALLYQEKISSEAGLVKALKDTAVSALLHEEKSTIRKAYELPAYSPEYNSILKGKGAFVLHMLRYTLGEENFWKLMKTYVQEFGYRSASIADFKTMAEKISSQNLTYFFAQWIDQSGVPKFEYSFTTWRVRDGFKVTGTIKQDLDTFRSPMEIQIETDGNPETKQIEVVGPESQFTVSTFGKPRRVKLDPNLKVLSIGDELGVDVQIARGDELRRLGQMSDAVAEYQRAIELKKRSSLAFFRIGEVFLEQRSYQSAANSFREALNGDLQPKWIEVWAHLNLGKVFDLLGQRERALREYQQAIDTNDNTQNAQEVAQKLVQSPYQAPDNEKIIK